MVLVLLGTLAGAISTTVGMGGGQLLVVLLAAWAGPLAALLWTGPALLIGNVHRSWMFRSRIAWAGVGRFAIGAVPGAALGGLIAGRIPEDWVGVGIAVLAVLAIGRRFVVSADLPSWSLLPGGLLVGGVAATGGGAGLLAAPLWRSAGVHGDGYVGSMAAGAGTVHIARLAGYSAGGMLDGTMLVAPTLLGAGVLFGNLLGRSLRGRLEDRMRTRLEWGAVVGAAFLAVLGAVW